MAEEKNSVPIDSDDTRTRKTVKMSGLEIAGRTAPKIDLAGQSAESAPASGVGSTVTRRTLKLQNLAQLATPAPKPAAAPPPAPAAEAGDDTRTRRTVKLTSLAAAPAAVTPLSHAAPAPAPAPASVPEPAPADDTVTRRTQKLEALDTQDVVALTAEDLEKSVDDTRTRRTQKLEAVPEEPPKPSLDPQDTRTGKIAVQPVSPRATIDLNAKPATATVAIRKPEAPAPSESFKAGNVDDTVKLQRPAPKPAMPGSVTPAAQGPGAPAVGGIKLNRPKAAAPAPAAPPAEPAAEAEAPAAPEAAAPAEPTGNLGKNQEPPKKKSGLKVNTDALADLGSAPILKEGKPDQLISREKKKRDNSSLIYASFAVFASLAALLMVFIAAVAVTDYFNIWHPSEGGKIELPIVSQEVIKYGK